MSTVENSEQKSVLHCCRCNVRVEHKGAYHPFCSERCKLIDFNNWLDGVYTISSSTLDEENHAS